ncbi:MAG: ATP-binding protein, partial [Acidobacteriota bacterium]|nr:ATP-binding protein [Acidobacteriota bacterium]
LNMQAGTIKEAQAVAALRESERRVMAMAEIHERLYGHKRMDRINFGDYARTLVSDLICSYTSDSSQIKCEFSLVPIDLNIEQAIPCGLILNELITNALKYAYPNGAQGSISVAFQQMADQKICLSVSDRGQGLPKNFEWKKSKSLGVTIVNLLTKQLGGTLQIESLGTGAAFSVIFPKVN